MRRLVFFLLTLNTLVGFAQAKSDTLYVKLLPETLKQVVLYSADGAQQKYITHSNSTNGEFKLAIPSDAPHAAYRLVYNRETMDYIDFLYVGKPFEFTYDTSRENTIPVFKNSEDNNRYFKALFLINQIQQKMDSAQIESFKTNDAAVLAQLTARYTQLKSELDKTTTQIEKTEPSALIKDILKAHERVLPDQPLIDPMEYLPFIKQHFFDHIDFNNTNLIHSSVLVDKVMDYVFYLTVGEDATTQNQLYKNAVKDVLDKISNEQVRKSFVQSLIQSFLQDENTAVIDYIFDTYYDKFPENLKNESWENGIKENLKTAISRKAPDFEFLLNNKNINLYKLNGYEYYVIAFWSTSCSHCMHEIPLFYDFIKGRSDTKVLAVGMETFESQNQWETEKLKYPEFVNVLGMGKWQNPIAQDYNVHATPNYFILDEHKTIIAKPYDLEAIVQFFEAVKP